LRRRSRTFTRLGISGIMHLSTGQEAVPVGFCAHLKKEDYILSSHRGHGHVLAKRRWVQIYDGRALWEKQGARKTINRRPRALMRRRLLQSLGAFQLILQNTEWVNLRPQILVVSHFIGMNRSSRVTALCPRRPLGLLSTPHPWSKG